MTWLWILPLSAIPVLLVARYSHTVTQQQWAFVLSGVGMGEIQRLRDLSSVERGLARASYLDARGPVDPAEVRRLLDVAYAYVSGLTDRRLARLAHMAQIARMAAAIAEVKPLLPRDYELGQIRTAAALSLVAHHVLVSSGERFRLHVSTLSLGFKLARRALRKAQAGPKIDAGLDDWATLDEAHIEAFRLVLMTLEAEAAKGEE